MHEVQSVTRQNGSSESKQKRSQSVCNFERLILEIWTVECESYRL